MDHHELFSTKPIESFYNPETCLCKVAKKQLLKGGSLAPVTQNDIREKRLISNRDVLTR